MTTGLYVGPWKACTAGGDCADTLNLVSDGRGNVIATRFFMLTAVFPAFALLALPFLAKFGYLGDIKAANASWYLLIYIGVSSFISMCVWAAFQYDVLANYTNFGKWTPDWALGLSCLAWLLAVPCAAVVYAWKMKSMGPNSALAQTKAKSVEISTTTSAATAPTASHFAPPPRTQAPAPSYPTPQPLNTAPQYSGEQPQQSYDQQQYDQQQQYGQPGVDV